MVSGSIVGFTMGWLWFGVIGVIGLGVFGLILDWIVSNNFRDGKNQNSIDWWSGGNNAYWFDSSSSGSSSGGWGGFGGGSSGGGGASSSW